MTPLPRALAAWSEPLSLFPRELALSLGSCVRRLAQAVGAMPHPSQESSDQPDGYDGLSRRGPYERLVVSEWLLADEAPEEFLRRAAQREHPFLALSFRQPGGARRSVALFDAGPELIGGPRIGQLAALIVLSARARRDRAPFGWGVLQDEGRQISDEVTPATILRLLFSRTARAAGTADVEAWRQAAGEPLAADDLWVVGTSRSPRVGAASRVELEDALEPGSRQLVATIHRARSAGRTVELPLPAKEDCVRLVRDPFSARKAPARPQALGSPCNGIAFSPNGRRLLVRHRNGGISAHPVPNSPRMPPGNPKTFMPRAGETVIAAGWTGTGCVVLVQTAEGFQLHGPQRATQPPVYRLQDAVQLTPSTAPAPLSPLVPLYRPARRGVLAASYAFLDAESRLFAVTHTGGRFLVRLCHRDVLAFTGRGGRFHVLRGEESGPSRFVIHERVSYERASLDAQRVPSLPGLRAVFGCDTDWIAVERALDEWEVFAGSSGRTMRAPYGSEVFGVARGPSRADEVALLLINPDRRGVRLLGDRRWVDFPRTTSPIVHAVASGAGPEIATLTADGMVSVLSLEHRRPVLELRFPGVRSWTGAE